MSKVIPSNNAYVGTKGELDRAGDLLRISDEDHPDYDSALETLSKWRTAHAFPLNTFQTNLRERAKRFGDQAFVAQRLKRTPTIIDKLERYPQMKLSRMQDIGGCRAVLPSVSNARKLCSEFVSSSIRHELVRRDDYILEPKPSGYRGIHLIYRYKSDRKTAFNGYQIELQVRSLLQHQWATAVETVGLFTEQSLKSSQGSEAWLRLFKDIGSYFAEKENCPPVAGTHTGTKLILDIKRAAKMLKVREQLSAFGAALRTVDTGAQKKAGYFLLELKLSERKLGIRTFKAQELAEATSAYLDAEKNLKTAGQVVLVRSDSLDGLKRAYPNYYLDTRIFLSHLKSIGI